jgi:hypothetical protein
MKIKTTLYFFLIAIMPFFSCSKSDDGGDDNTNTEKPDLGTPATEHHDNDGVKDNGDGSSGVTMANTLFHTIKNDYSSETKVTDDKSPTANLVESYDIGNNLMNFRVHDDMLVAGEKISAFDTKVLLFDLAGKKVLDEHNPDSGSYLSGFDFNGAIMTTEGSENISFYKVENGKITKHFFIINSFLGSKFLSSGFLDDDHAYIYNSDEIQYFHLGDSKNSKKAMDIESFSQIYFDSDENFVYVMVRSWGKNSIIKKFDKKTMSLSSDMITLNSEGYGMAVDANYIYVSNKDNNKVEIYNKHTANIQGDFNIKSPGLIDYNNGSLYVFSEDNNSVNKYGITFN